MRHAPSTLAVFVLLTAYTTASEPETKTAGQKALNEWQGTWESQIELKPAAWSPNARELSGMVQAEWILKRGSRFEGTSALRKPPDWEFVGRTLP